VDGGKAEKSNNNITWDSFPFRDESPKKTAALLLCIFLISFFSASVFNISYGFLSVLLLTFSFRKYFLRTHYVLDGEGVTVSSLLFTKRRIWNYYSRIFVMKDGVFLSPFPLPSRFDSFRGDFLKQAEKNKIGEIVAFAERQMVK